MTFLPRMAFKNLSRYKKRTMITAGAIAYGIMMFVLMRSLLAGIDQESETNLRLYETASGRIMDQGYWDDRESLPLELSFKPSVVAPLLESLDAAYSPRINFGGDLIFYKDPFPEDGNIPGKFTAIDPESDTDVFKLKDSLAEGEWLDNSRNGLMLGQWLAEDIGATIGAPVLVQTQTRNGYAQVLELEVVGILNSPNPEITRSGMFLPLNLADDSLEMDGNVTELNVNFGMDKAADRAFSNMAPAVEELGLEALNWRVLGADFIAISQTKAGATGMIVILILIIAAVGISNTMLMAVYERVRELGMMRAMGMSDRKIRELFLWESAGIGLLGAAYGVALGALINWPLVKFGLDYSSLMRENSFGYRSLGEFYGVWDPLALIMAFVLGVALTVLVAVFSTHRILRLDIPSSLRFQ